MRKRVVVTGLSALTPIGNTAQESWKNLLAGKSGIAPITLFDAQGFAARIAGELKNFRAEDYLETKQIKRMDRFCHFAVAAGKMLMEDSRFPLSEENADEIGVILGCGLGGLKTIEDFHSRLVSSGPGRVSPFFIPMLIANMSAGQVAMHTGIKGVNMTTTSACASSLHAIGSAYSDIVLGRTTAMLTGGVESTITPMGISGFTAMKALSTRNDEPQHASRPFDRDRDGFVMGEGAGFLLLESLDHAVERGARIYAEVIGYGASDDAFHIAAPEESGRGMAMAMRKALRDANVAAQDIDHVNAHATSTPTNDRVETKALKLVFGDHARNLKITANKSMIGHLLGAAGGVESVFSVLTLDQQHIPGTINLFNQDEDCDLVYCRQSEKTEVRYVLCNSFGFGGTNASVLFKRYEA